MDGAQTWGLYLTITPVHRVVMSRGLRGLRRSFRVICSGAAPGTDLGGSSNYSSENLEDRSGEGFHTNSSWLWVSRSLEPG